MTRLPLKDNISPGCQKLPYLPVSNARVSGRMRVQQRSMVYVDGKKTLVLKLEIRLLDGKASPLSLPSFRSRLGL